MNTSAIPGWRAKVDPLAFFLALSVGCFLLYRRFVRQERQVGSNLQMTNGLQPRLVFQGWGSSPSLGIDPASQSFAISYGDAQPEILAFSDLVAVEVMKDGMPIHRTNRGSQLVGAFVGNLFFGERGFIAGALSGSTRTEEKVKKLSLKIYTTNFERPYHELVFFQSKKGYASNSNYVVTAIRQMEEWLGRMRIILKTVG